MGWTGLWIPGSRFSWLGPVLVVDMERLEHRIVEHRIVAHRWTRWTRRSSWRWPRRIWRTAGCALGLVHWHMDRLQYDHGRERHGDLGCFYDYYHD
jgi:hypothetical protein